MTTENTAVETQADESTEKENTIAEENQKKIEEEVDKSSDEAKETEKDIPIKISETETLNLKYYLKTDKKDKFFVGVSQLSGDDNPLSMPLSNLAKIISNNPYFDDSLSTINVTPNELFVSFDKPLPDDDNSKRKWLVGGDVTLASTKDLSLFLNGNLKNASFEGESFFVLATGNFTKEKTESINERLSEDNNKIIIPSNADKDDAVAIGKGVELSGKAKLTLKKQESVKEEEKEKDKDKTKTVALDYFLSIEEKQKNFVAFGKNDDEDVKVSLPILLTSIKPDIEILDALAEVTITVKDLLIVYDKSVDTENKTENKTKKSKWLIDTKIKIEATNLGEFLKGDLSKAKLTDDSHLIYASQDLNKSDVEDINLKIFNKDNHLEIPKDAEDDTVVIPQETKITGTLEVEVGSNTSRKVNLGYDFKIDKTNTSLVAFGKTKNNPSVNIKDLVSVIEPSAYVPESLSKVNISLKDLLLVYDKSVSKPVNKVESASESDVEAKGEKTTEKKWLIKGDINLDSGDLEDIFDGHFKEDKVKMDCHFTYASQDFNKEDVESINKKITDESGKIKIPEKVKDKEETKKELTKDKDKTENKKEENKDKKKEKDKKKDDIIIIHQGTNIFGTLELDIDSENGNTKKIELDYYYKKEKTGKSVIAVSKAESEKKPLKVNLGALVKKIDDHADLANTLSEDTVTFEYLTLVYDKPTDDKKKSKWLIGGDIDLDASKIDLKNILGDRFNKAEFHDNFLLLYASQDFTKKEVKNINSKLPEKSKAIAIGKNAEDDTVIISKGVYIYGTLKFDLSKTEKIELDYSIKLEKEDKNLVAVSPDTVTVDLGQIIKNIDESSSFVDKFSNKEIKLNYLLLTDDKPNEGSNKALLGGDLNISIPDLSNLPLFGNITKDVKLPIGTDLLLLYSTGTFTKTEVEKLNAKLPDKAYGIEITEKAEDDTVVVKKGLNFFSKLNYDDTPELKVADDKEKENQTDNQQLANVSTLLLVENKIEEETSTSIPTKWLKVQKKIGPLEVDKIGIGFDIDNVAVVFLANGSLKVGGFSLALEGLSISEPLKGGLPTVDLQAIAVDISKAGCFELAGAMVKYKHDKTKSTEYIGELKIQVGTGGETLEIMLLGAYSDFQNQASFFGYGFVGFPIPCPPDIIFEGVALGLGYNQSFTAPGVDQIENFPFVSEVMNPSPTDADSENGKAGKILKELEGLNNYIHPQLSADFGAIGVKLNAFQMIDAFALLVFAAGSHFELDLLGMAQMSFPLDESAVSPLAFIDLAMEAVIDPSAGYFKLAAQLTTQSYIFDKECHITGGMAFDMWYGGENAGDFALTLGGYSPRFNVPAHYPQAPRLGLNWQVYEHLQIRGGAYFAFCPHALMAGGDISAEFHEGDAYASFDFNLDILINWKPFHYDIYTGIDVKAGYGIFGPYEFHLNLHIWGPEFSGTLTIDVPFHSFTIGFGAASPQQPQPIDYSQFKKSFLPSDDKICTVTVNKGLVKQIPQKDNTNLIVVNPKNLCLKTHSLIPSKTATIGGEKTQNLNSANTSFGIAAMNLSSTELETSHKITVTRGGSNVENDFEFIPVYQNLAKGMWGTQISCEINDYPLLNNVLSGFKITPKHPVKPVKSHDICTINTNELVFEDFKEAKYQWESIESYDNIQPNCSEKELLAALGIS